jgi:hypothetical protein
MSYIWLKIYAMIRFLPSFFIAIFTVIFTNTLTGQGLTYEVPLIEQVQNSSQIVEGKVIAKASYWDTAQGHIYTVNTVEVYKVFKGLPSTTLVEVITPGGTVGLSAELVTPSLELFEGEIGVFMLEDTDVALARQDEAIASFRPYSSSQGFYKYDLVDNKAVNNYKVKTGISQTFYNELEGLTNQVFVPVKAFDVDELIAQNTSDNNRQPIFGINPLVTTAGTQSTITISGVAFGPSQGTVSFANADNGGATFTPALDSQVLSWSDDEIVVEVPRQAGTGRVRVTPNSGGVSTSPQDITVLYSELNVVSSGVAYPTRHFDQNGSGGMTWQMQTDFDANAAAKASFLRAFDTWVCESGVNWENGPTTTVDAVVLDGINIVRFDNGAELQSGTLGVNFSYWSGCNSGGQLNWFVNELDIVFNDSTNWQFGPGNPSGSQIDFETVAVHELGHGHQLGHVIDPTVIMHFSVSGGVAKRILSQNDIDGANDIQLRSVNEPVCGLDPMTNSDCSLSISDEELNEKIVIYPLPAKDNIYIESAFDLNLKSVELIDAQGRLVSTIKLSQNSTLHSVNLEALNSGMYFLKITTSTNAQLVKKIVVE